MNSSPFLPGSKPKMNNRFFCSKIIDSQWSRLAHSMIFLMDLNKGKQRCQVAEVLTRFFTLYEASNSLCKNMSPVLKEREENDFNNKNLILSYIIRKIISFIETPRWGGRSDACQCSGRNVKFREKASMGGLFRDPASVLKVERGMCASTRL